MPRREVSPGEVVGALSAVIRAEHRHAVHLVPAMGLGLSDVLALYHLANEPLGAKALADRVGLSTGSTTALIDRLVAQGMVHRHAHPTDRRAVVIEMTTDGHAQTFSRMQQFIVAIERLATSLDSRQRVAVVDFLRSVEHVISTETDRLDEKGQT